MPSLNRHLPWLRLRLDLLRACSAQDHDHVDLAHGLGDLIGHYEALVADIEESELDSRSDGEGPVGGGAIEELLRNPGVLSLKMLEKLPQELRGEVKVGESEKFEAAVMKLLGGANGQPMLLDNILIGVYLLTGKTYKRLQLNNRLYRMVQRGLIASASGKKGQYVATRKQNDVLDGEDLA